MATTNSNTKVPHANRMTNWLCLFAMVRRFNSRSGGSTDFTSGIIESGAPDRCYAAVDGAGSNSRNGCRRPQGLKPGTQRTFSARLKPCPPDLLLGNDFAVSL